MVALGYKCAHVVCHAWPIERICDKTDGSICSHVGMPRVNMVPHHYLASKVVVVGYNNFGTIKVKTFDAIKRIRMRPCASWVMCVTVFYPFPKIVYLDIEREESSILVTKRGMHTLVMELGFPYYMWNKIDVVGRAYCLVMRWRHRRSVTRWCRGGRRSRHQRNSGGGRRRGSRGATVTDQVGGARRCGGGDRLRAAPPCHKR